MGRKEMVFVLGVLVVSALLIANLLKPTAPHAYEMTAKEAGQPLAISAAGDSAWAIVGNKVYYLSIRSRSEFPAGQRTINVIDAKAIE